MPAADRLGQSPMLFTHGWTLTATFEEIPPIPPSGHPATPGRDHNPPIPVVPSLSDRRLAESPIRAIPDIYRPPCYNRTRQAHFTRTGRIVSSPLDSSTYAPAA